MLNALAPSLELATNEVDRVRNRRRSFIYPIIIGVISLAFGLVTRDGYFLIAGYVVSLGMLYAVLSLVQAAT